MITTHVYQIKKGTFGRHDIMRRIYYRRNLVAKKKERGHFEEKQVR